MRAVVRVVLVATLCGTAIGSISRADPVGAGPGCVMPSPSVTTQYTSPNPIDPSQPLAHDVKIWLPSGAATDRPAVVYVHGGDFWKAGTFPPGGDPGDPCLVNELLQAGYVWVAVNYLGVAGPSSSAACTSGPFAGQPNTGSLMYPETPGVPWTPDPNATLAVSDVQAAVAWLREPAQLAAYGIDPARIGALGDSAGGLLAAMLGAGTTAPESRVSAVVSVSGPMDLTQVADPVPECGTVLNELLRVGKDFLGCDQGTEPCKSTTARAVSPVSQITSANAPVLMSNAQYEGVNDGTGPCTMTFGCFGIPVGQAQEMAAALTAAGICNDLIVIPDSTAHDASLPLIQAQAISWFDTYVARRTSNFCGTVPIVAPPTFTG